MSYKRVVAYVPEVSVIFELEDGMYALVSAYEDVDASLSEYAETFLRFGTFEDAKDIPQTMLRAAEIRLERQDIEKLKERRR